MSGAGEASAAPAIRIEPTRGWAALRLGEVWRRRELLYFLVWRDVKVRYKQTALGATWAVAQPLLGMAVFTLFFGRLGKIPSDGVPYELFAFAALVPWNFFSNGLQQSTQSLVAQGNLLRKVYFPRLLIPISTILSGAVDFAIAFAVLLAMMAAYGFAPGPGAALLPLFALLAVAASLGVGLWLSALNVRYRDVRYVVPFLTQFWMLATPIAYPSSLVPERFRALLGINPMAGVVEGFRWALLGTDASPGPVVLASCLAAAFLLATGALYFRRMERSFADVV